MEFLRKLPILFLLSVLSIFVFSCDNSSNVIAVIQFGKSESLDNCYKGFRSEFARNSEIEKEVKFEHYDSQFSKEKAASIAKKLVKRKVRAIVAIGEGVVAEAAEAASGKGIPVIWAGLINNESIKSYPNTSGISFGNELNGDLELISAFFPKVPAVRIGVVTLNTSTNGIGQVKELRELGNSYKMLIYADSVFNADEIPSKIEHMIERASEPINCFLIINDDLVMANASKVIDTCKAHNIPVFGNTESQVEQGAIAGYTIDYNAIGVNTAKKVIDILAGAYIMNLTDYGIGMNLEFYNPQVAEEFYKNNIFISKPENVDDYNIIQKE